MYEGLFGGESEENEGYSKIKTKDKSKAVFGWLRTTENIKDILGCTFFEVLDLEIQQYFNFMGYLTFKNNELKKQYDNNGIS